MAILRLRELPQQLIPHPTQGEPEDDYTEAEASHGRKELVNRSQHWICYTVDKAPQTARSQFWDPRGDDPREQKTDDDVVDPIDD